MTKKPVYFFGSISHGTMRNEDLIPVFADTLEELDKANDGNHSDLIHDANLVEDFENDEAYFILEDLFNALDEYSAPYCYFGAHEGDGSDYGFWFSEDAVDATFDGLKVNDLSEVPDDYVGEIFLTNDHGNLIFLVQELKPVLREVWAIV